MDWGNLNDQNPFLGQNNPYLQQIIDAASGDVTRNFNLTTRPAGNAALVRSGSFGNTGLEEMQRNDDVNLQKTLADLSSKLRFNDYGQQQQEYNWQQEFGRNLANDGYSQNRNDLQIAMGLLGTVGGANSQDINAATTQQNTPLNYWQQFTNQASGVGSGFGTQTQTQGTTSSPLATALGGAQLGSKWWNGQQSSAPISASDQANFDSFGASNGWWGTK